MAVPSEVRKELAQTIESHRRWLSRFPAHLRRWESALENLSGEESALIEACVRQLLADRADEVEPHESPSDGGPDFRFRLGCDWFLAEATAIEAKKVAEQIGIPDSPGGPIRGRYGTLTRAVQEKARRKTPQLAETNHPGILMVGTLHRQLGFCLDRNQIEFLFTSDPKITGVFDAETGRVGQVQNIVDLQYSSLAKWNHIEGIVPMRRSISAIVLSTFAGIPRTYGLLNPDAVRPISFLPIRGVDCAAYVGSDASNSPRFSWTTR